MKLIISGGRDYQLTNCDIAFLNTLANNENIEMVLVGGASGVDAAAEKWARAKGFAVLIFPAKWKQYGLSAGHIRNAEMADIADAVVLFNGGKGTQSMYMAAKRKNLRIYDCRDKQNVNIFLTN